LKKQAKKGISTVAGTVLFIILIFTLQTILFVAAYRYNSFIQDAIKTETDRRQEKIVLVSLLTDNSTGIENVYALMVNNTGSITVRIRAIYIDNQFLCDPSDRTINPDDTYVNPKETSWILMPQGVPYNPASQITVATERGTKSTDYEGKLKQAEGGKPPTKFEKFYLGPLMLDFTKFYFAKVNPQTGDLTSEWRPGWSVDTDAGSIAWKITVKNIDDRDITINQFSVFTLWANDQPSNRRPWYIEPPPNSLTQHIKSNETVQIIYKWATPKTNQTKLPNTQGIYTTEARCRTFLTFFGIFHESDGTTKPYGQTIPFEAVLVVKPATIQVTASPNVIVIKSTMTSTITAVVKRGTTPIVGANLTFITTAGTLSKLWNITDVNGRAIVYLNAHSVMSPATAMVTATWLIYSGSVTVSLAVETIQVSASPTEVAINSTMNSTITAQVTASGTPIVGVTVTFTTNAGSLTAPSAITDANGVARVNLTAGILPTIANVTTIWINTLGYTTVRFTNLYITTNKPTYFPHDNVTVSGLLRDVNGAIIQGVVVSISVSAPNGTVISSENSTPTDSNGAFIYEFQLPINATLGTYTITAACQTYEEKYQFTVT